MYVNDVKTYVKARHVNWLLWWPAWPGLASTCTGLVSVSTDYVHVFDSWQVQHGNNTARSEQFTLILGHQ